MKQIPYLLVITLATIASCTSTAKQEATIPISRDSLVRRGAYLVRIAGCEDCHSPKTMTPMGPVPDSTRRFSGHRENLSMPDVPKTVFANGWVLINAENTALATPGFVSFSANISSDTTGIGTWTFEQFKTAMTKGKYKGLPEGRDLLPPMPWPNYAGMSEEDLEAIFTFLQSTKPVHNIVPHPIPAGSF